MKLSLMVQRSRKDLNPTEFVDFEDADEAVEIFFVKVIVLKRHLAELSITETEETVATLWGGDDLELEIAPDCPAELETLLRMKASEYHIPIRD